MHDTEQLLRQLADQRTRQARPAHPDAYRAKVLETLRTEHEAKGDQWLADYAYRQGVSPAGMSPRLDASPTPLKPAVCGVCYVAVAPDVPVSAWEFDEHGWRRTLGCAFRSDGTTCSWAPCQGCKGSGLVWSVAPTGDLVDDAVRVPCPTCSSSEVTA